jgi:hypothetical protein
VLEQVGFRLHGPIGAGPGEVVVEDERKSRSIGLTQSIVKGCVDLEKIRMSVGDRCYGENCQSDESCRNFGARRVSYHKRHASLLFELGET